jgi:RND superfamily putative drug exporter
MARRSARHPWLTLGVWVLLIAAAVWSAGQIKFNDAQTIDRSDSLRASQLMEDLRGEEVPAETIVVSSIGATVDTQQYSFYVSDLASQVRRLPDVKSVVTYYDTRDESFVSQDRTKTIIAVELNGDIQDAADNVDGLMTVLDESGDSNQGFVAMTVGDGSLNKETMDAFEKDLQRAEFIGVPAALVVLLIVFGAAVAAGVPVLLGLLGILIAVGATAALSQYTTIGTSSVNMISMIGLAVGIDYTLFIVERFREERARGRDKIAAIEMAAGTASRAVLFSGATVVVALAGLLIVPSSVFRGLAYGAIFVVIAAVAIAMTLLPAVLSLLGDKINWLHLPGRGRTQTHESTDGFWGRTATTVMRHPVVAIAASTAILVAASVPFVTMKLGSSGLRDYPDNLETVQAFRTLDRDFSAGRVAPSHILIEGDAASSPTTRASVEELRNLIADDKGFGGMGQLEVSADGRIAGVDVLTNGDPIGPDARAAVDRLRNDYIPQAFAGEDVDVVVGGGAAGTNDYVNAMTTYLPIVIAFVLAMSFILLMVVFRSIVIPVKAILMNLLSVGAAYGLITLVFQHGFGDSVLGFQQTDSIAAFLPVFLFAVLFGLSMDYHVFLLTRIQERFLATKDNAAAVSYGLRSTAHIITGAAAIMMVVFAGFAMGDMVELQQMGFGLAVAVFIDATIVRSVLVPASMAMLGEWNWYLPSWLNWLPRIHVEGQTHDEPVYAPVPAAAAGFAVGGGGD